MKKQINKAAKVNNSNKAAKNVVEPKGKKPSIKKVVIPKTSKVILSKLDKSLKFDSDKANSYDKLLQTSRLVVLDGMSLSKAFSRYTAIAKSQLTTKQMGVLTFKSIIKHLEGSKYGKLQLFSVHQVALVCNEILKANDLNTKRAIKVAKQNKAIAKK